MKIGLGVVDVIVVVVVAVVFVVEVGMVGVVGGDFVVVSSLSLRSRFATENNMLLFCSDILVVNIKLPQKCILSRVLRGLIYQIVCNRKTKNC